MDAAEVEAIVLEAIRTANLARDSSEQMEVSPTAAIFGPGSPLDSLGLVALLIDVEDSLRAAGAEVTLSDDRAMSQKHSPFRNVPRLVAYIATILQEPA